MRCLMKAWPDFDSTASPPARSTISMVFQVRRGSCTTLPPGSPRSSTEAKQPHDVVALDEGAVLVEEEAAVEIPVPGEPEIRAVSADRRDGRRPVLLEHGIRDAVGKAAVGLVVDLDELERQVRLQLVDDEPRPAVAGIDHDFQGLELRHIDIGQQVRDIRVHGVDARRAPRRLGSANCAALGKAANLVQAVVAR